MVSGKESAKNNIAKDYINKRIVTFLNENNLAKINPMKIIKILARVNKSDILSPVMNTERSNKVEIKKNEYVK